MEDLKEYKLSKQYQFFKVNFKFTLLIEGKNMKITQVNYSLNNSYKHDLKKSGKLPKVNKDDNGYYFNHLKEKVYFKPYNFYK